MQKAFQQSFFSSFVLEILTYLTLVLKSKIIRALKNRTAILYKIITFFCVWFVLFISKFIFIWAIDAVFGEDIAIHGFFGIMLVVAAVTNKQKLADTIFIKLGDAR